MSNNKGFKDYEKFMYVHDDNEVILLTKYFYIWQWGKHKSEVYCHRKPRNFDYPKNTFMTENKINIFKIDNSEIASLMSKSRNPLKISEVRRLVKFYYDIETINRISIKRFNDNFQ